MAYNHRTKVTDRPRQRAIVMLASTLIGWVAIYQLVVWWRSDATLKLERPPQFHVDLDDAGIEELLLLPDVGEKTARSWRKSLDDSPMLPPRTAKEIEALPSVGPIRAEKLSPFLLESDGSIMESLEAINTPSRPTKKP